MPTETTSSGEDPGRLAALAALPFLNDVPPSLLTELEKELSYFSLPAGWRLFDVGEPSDRLFVVLSGSLGAFRSSGGGGEGALIGHIRSGEPAGEMSLLAGVPHQHAVYALRDTELLAITRAGFMRLIRSAPAVLERLTVMIMARLRQSTRRRRTHEPRIFALLSTSPTIDMRLRSALLAEKLRDAKLRVAILTEADQGGSAEDYDAIERTHDIVFLVAAIGDTPWYRFVQRHADRLLIFARSDAVPSTPLLPDDPSPARQFRLADIVLLHHASPRFRSQPRDWMGAARAARLFHWRGTDDSDTRRLARVISGKSTGLVLSGGGARAYAHVGALRALSEYGCAFDFAGGTSMGAVIAAGVALGWSIEEIDRRIRAAFVRSNPLSDYRLPVVALLKGRRVEERLHEHFGDILIEDMTLPFFCVSSNLSQGSAHVHTAGSLRQSLRASISLPGILPPVVRDRQVLVDGAVLNNFPVDIMRDMHRGRNIGVDAAQAPQALRADDFENPLGFFAWTARNGFSAPPPIANLLMRAATVGAGARVNTDSLDLLVTPKLEGIELRDWKSYDEAVEAGYVATLRALEGAGETLKADLVTSLPKETERGARL